MEQLKKTLWENHKKLENIERLLRGQSEKPITPTTQGATCKCAHNIANQELALLRPPQEIAHISVGLPKDMVLELEQYADFRHIHMDCAIWHLLEIGFACLNTHRLDVGSERDGWQ